MLFSAIVCIIGSTDPDMTTHIHLSAPTRLAPRSIVDSCSFPQQYLCKWPITQGTVSLGQFFHLRSVSSSPVLPCPVHSNTIYDMVWTHPKCIPPEQSRQLHKAIVAGAVAGIRTHIAAIAWVSRPALNPPRHKSTPAARQTESDPAPTTLFPLFNFWVVPVCLGPPPLPALTPDRSPPRPPILAHLDPHTPRAWSALALNRGPPWLPIVVRLGPRFWPALTCYGRPLINSKQE